MLPWAIVCQVSDLNTSDAWKYHSLVYGGSLVFSFVDIFFFGAFWAWSLLKGRMRLEVFREPSWMSLALIGYLPGLKFVTEPLSVECNRKWGRWLPLYSGA